MAIKDTGLKNRNGVSKGADHVSGGEEEEVVGDDDGVDLKVEEEVVGDADGGPLGPWIGPMGVGEGRDRRGEEREGTRSDWRAWAGGGRGNQRSTPIP